MLTFTRHRHLLRSVFSLTLLLGLSLALMPTALATEKAHTVDEIIVDKSDRRLHLITEGQIVRSYTISLGSCPIGAKTQQGDKKTPEGRYVIDWRNSESRYYRSFHISYPDQSDREKARQRGVDPGGMIMILGLPDSATEDGEGYIGMDWTDGCIALTNEEIDQLWKSVKDGTPIEIVP